MGKSSGKTERRACFNFVRIQYAVEHNFLASTDIVLEELTEKYGHSI